MKKSIQIPDSARFVPSGELLVMQRIDRGFKSVLFLLQKKGIQFPEYPLGKYINPF
jgi:hypothetical protein